MGRRFLTYLLTKLIFFIPMIFCSAFLFYAFLEPLLTLPEDYNGVGIVFMLPVSVSLNLGSLILYYSKFNEILFMIYISVFFTSLFTDFLISLTYKIDEDNTFFGYRLFTIKAKKVTVIKLFVRSVVKYLSITIFPAILLLPLLSDDKLYLHEKASGLYKRHEKDITYYT